MCLILLAYRMRADAPLIVAANRDEFYARPAAPARYWDDAPQVFAGRDLEAGGTWLGVDTAGRFATVTNFADASVDSGADAPEAAAEGATTGRRTPAALASRGDLPRAFLTGTDAKTRGALGFAQAIDGARYAGFSLLLFDGTDLVYLSNRADGPRHIGPGIYGLANTHLEANWPKVRRGTAALRRILHGPVTGDALLAILADEHRPPDDELPQRGRSLDVERRLAPCFIRGTDYGTRASTAVILRPDAIELDEQSYGPNGEPGDRVSQRIAVN